MLVLGIHFGHGSAAALVDNGQAIAMIEEEKLNRIKGFIGFPYQAIDYVLSLANARVEDVDRVAIGCTNISEFSYGFFNLVDTIFRQEKFWPKTKGAFLNYVKRSWPNWDTSSLLELEFDKLVEEEIGIPRHKIIKVNHHLAHAASAFYCSPWQEAIIITADGKGDGFCGGTYCGDESGIRVIDNVPDRFSIGQFYQSVTKYLGYKVNRHEGKITGLAAFGVADRTYPLMQEVLNYGDDGQIRNSFYEDKELTTDPLAYFKNKVEDKDYINTRQVRLLNGALRGYTVVHQLYQNFLRNNMGEYSPEDLASGVQRLAEESLRTYVTYQLKDYFPCKVCLAGGVFANVKVNQRINEIKGVDGIYVQPAMDDAGCALGAALQVVAEENGSQTMSRGLLGSVYKGPGYDEREMETALQESALPYRKSAAVAEELAEMLHAGKVIGRFDGELEWGPRALGNRSILVRPTEKSINDSLNKRLERTEFMPFAPSILAENADDYLIGYQHTDEAAKYMTMTYATRLARRAEISAAVHIDGTTRPQVVFSEDNASFHRIISAYKRISGIAALINTSFNMHEEPIVNTPSDAIRAFCAGAVDVLSMGPFIIQKK